MTAFRGAATAALLLSEEDHERNAFIMVVLALIRIHGRLVLEVRWPWLGVLPGPWAHRVRACADMECAEHASGAA